MTGMRLNSAPATRRRRLVPIVAVVALTISVAGTPTRALSWDSGTHRLITRLAIGGLPASPLKTMMSRNERVLEEFSVEPDTVLKKLYGKAEGRHHYVNLEYFGTDPFAKLNPDFNTMERRFGAWTLARSGTLPWTIEARADELDGAWRRGDCAGAIRTAGYLAHYVGDASQPLHTTVHFDGYRRDRGIHQRFELAVAQASETLGELATSKVRVEGIHDVWTPVIAELRQSHSEIERVIADDRAMRAEGTRAGYADRKAMVDREAPMLTHQLALAASTLGSIWMFEWNRAGEPSACVGRVIQHERRHLTRKRRSYRRKG